MTYPQVQVIPNQSGPRLLWQVFVNRNPQATPNDPTWEMLQEFSSEEKARSFAADASASREKKSR